MHNYLLVGAGGALGAMARYGISVLFARAGLIGFPFATLTINIVGSLAMGVLFGFLGRGAPEAARLFLGVGALGGFTTFSAFSQETVMLMGRGELAQAALYVGLSVALSLCGFYLGLLMVGAPPQ